MANVALKREREQYGLPLLAQLVTVAPVEQLQAAAAAALRGCTACTHWLAVLPY